MNIDIPEYLFNFGYIPLALTIVLIWIGVSHMRPKTENGNLTGFFLTALIIVWFAGATYLGSQNFFWSLNNPKIPTIPFAIVMPIIIGLIWAFRSKTMARWVSAVPLAWLVGIQFYRILGGAFLVLWAQGHLPGAFALPAGIGDVLTGILALYCAYLVVKGAPSASRATYIWCLIGIGDLIVAVTMGTITAPGAVHLLSLDKPNILITAYPLVMVPAFAVPLSIILHGLVLWKLRLTVMGNKQARV